MSRVATIASFYLNRNYIAAHLCENRSNPSKHCCGKCQLKKQLAAQDKEQDKLPAQSSLNELLVFCGQPVCFKASDNFIQMPAAFAVRQFHSQKSSSGLFRPPCNLG
jgi:hypothetical protein